MLVQDSGNLTQRVYLVEFLLFAAGADYVQPERCHIHILAPLASHRDRVQRAIQTVEVFDTDNHNAPAVMQVNVPMNVANGVIQTYASPQGAVRGRDVATLLKCLHD